VCLLSRIDDGQCPESLSFHLFLLVSFSSWAQTLADSRQSLISEAQFRGRVTPCGIYGGQSGTGTGFSLSSSVFPVIIPPGPHARI
jgi:hypothetical protein